MVAKKVLSIVIVAVVGLFVFSGLASAQDRIPFDNGLWTYYTPPRARPSDSHPLRLAAYVIHPIGWVAREAVTRPLNYFISSSETTRSIFGYREPYDYRQPECFSADSSTPDCRAIKPYDYDLVEPIGDMPLEDLEVAALPQREVYFPDVNFDFDVRTLNGLGRGRVKQIGELLKQSEGVNIVLEGHTDFIGSDPYNEKLGLDRAEAVRQELVAQGVPAERLATVTFGKSKPILPEQTDWARAVNRRVEVHMDTGAAQ